MRPIKIISGGQTGVDRAAWDVAIELGLDWGGWVPKGRRAEDGRIPDRYDRCVEHESAGMLPRTRANIMAAHATLIVTHEWPLTGGTLATANYAERQGKPWEAVLGRPVDSTRELLRSWRCDAPAFVLNIAGPRASKWPQGYELTRAFLLEVLR